MASDASDVTCCASTRAQALIWLGVASRTPAALGLWGQNQYGRQPSSRFSEQPCLQSIRRVTEQSLQRLNVILCLHACTTFTSVHRRGKVIERRKEGRVGLGAAGRSSVSGQGRHAGRRQRRLHSQEEERDGCLCPIHGLLVI